MAKIKMNQQLLRFDGDPILDEQKEPIELRQICVNALMFNEPNIDGVKKLERFKLAKMLHSTDEVKLEAEQVSLLKELIGKNFVPMVSGSAWEVLDPG